MIRFASVVAAFQFLRLLGVAAAITAVPTAPNRRGAAAAVAVVVAVLPVVVSAMVLAGVMMAMEVAVAVAACDEANRPAELQPTSPWRRWRQAWQKGRKSLVKVLRNRWVVQLWGKVLVPLPPPSTGSPLRK